MFTPYPDVNELLTALLSGVRDVLGPRLIGAYLYGSLASGDFDPHSSDIDFMVVTDGALSAELIAALEAMHQRLWSSGQKWATKLEGSYITRADMRRYDPHTGLYPTVNEGQFYVAGHGSDWIIQRHIVREHGVVLAGPDPAMLIDPVTPDDLRRGAAGVLAEWWAPILQDNPAWVKPRLYQAFAVLTMCRVLYTLHHGEIASKSVSARWALETLGPQWRDLIERAMAWPDEPQPDELDVTLDFIRFTVAQTKLAQTTAAPTQEEIPSC